jgi:hypothetical protein
MQQTSESQIAEYQATQDCYLHYDSFRWQAGSLLIAGVFVFWGLLISSTPSPKVVGLSGLLVCGLMSIWILFAHHYRQIYLCKLNRLHELERNLLMKQHLRFIQSDKERYSIFGPKGHSLDMAMYVITSLGGSFLGSMQSNFDEWFLLPIPLTITVLVGVLINERRIRRSLKNIEKQS